MSKSKEGGRIFNNKVILVFQKCRRLKNIRIGIKTYRMISRLINKV